MPSSPIPDDPSLLDHVSPPFDLTSDMMFAAALCPTAPLKRAFPSIPFVSLMGQTPLVMWFSRIKEACARDEAGKRRCLSGKDTWLYDELNVIALLWQRAVFVPDIYATSELSIRLGHAYGMPKQPITMTVRGSGASFASAAIDGQRESFVAAQLLGPGRPLAKLASLFWPCWTWPVRFPSGSAIRALIQDTPQVFLAGVRAGQLWLEAGWLPTPLRLLPFGVYVPNLKMRLPPP